VAKQEFPWYDAEKGALRPLAPPPAPPEPKSTRLPEIDASPLRMFVNVLMFVLMGLGLAALIAALVWAWRVYGPSPLDLPEIRLPQLGKAARVGSLPAGLDIDLSDPWSEADRRRRAGDLGGATIALFVYLLTVLERMNLCRLAPGRTARQLVRATSDAWARARVEPTMRLFEAVYYGHRVPESSAFESAWTEAEALRQRAVEGGVA
jgi:hypothetical protein